MSVPATPSSEKRLRLLVAIASFGEKNIRFLRRIIQRYQALPVGVDVVVFSNAPKDLGPGVKVIVGLPSRDPWSLPFAHKAYFAENVERYDLFIYSEDDMEVTEANIRAFLQVTPELEPDEIAGFLRYETDESGGRSLPEVHGPFHWKPESVRRRGPHTVAEFTNEHAAFYLLTRDQLRRMIASGGFLRGPCRGKYDMLCTAATDPYTNCGFRKVICVSRLDNFLIHHVSNRYVGEWGLSLSAMRAQVDALVDISFNRLPVKTMAGVESTSSRSEWEMYYEKSSAEVMKAVPTTAKTILSVGCGWGATESQLKERGVDVVAIPLDSIIAVTARRRGIEVIDGTLEECLVALSGRRFDCLLITNFLHIPPSPANALEQCIRLIRENGTIVVSGRNFRRLPNLFRRVLGKEFHSPLSNGDEKTVRHCNPHILAKRTRGSGFLGSVQWSNHSPLRLRFMEVRCPMGMLTAQNWVLQARRGR